MRFAGACKCAREKQGPGIVVDTITVCAIRNRMYCVLQYAGAVAKRKEMSHLHVRNALPFSLGGNLAIRMRYFRSRTYCFKNGDITLRRLQPGHRTTVRVGSLSHGMTEVVVGQQARDLSADSFGVSKGNENTATVTQQFLGVPVRCRY